jgi:hypothetical protein
MRRQQRYTSASRLFAPASKTMGQKHLLPRLAAALPRINAKTECEERAEKSKDLAKASVLPCVLIHNSGETYWGLANDYLRHHESELKKQLNTLPELYPPVLDEAGEVAHARNDLLSPIMRALEFNSHMHDKVAALSQVDVNFLRVDLAMNYMSEDDGIVMLVEFKEAGSINTSNIKAKLVKQAKTYANASGCLHIALCDYESLVLLKFDDELALSKSRLSIRKLRLSGRLFSAFCCMPSSAAMNCTDEPAIHLSWPVCLQCFGLIQQRDYKSSGSTSII